MRKEEAGEEVIVVMAVNLSSLAFRTPGTDILVEITDQKYRLLLIYHTNQKQHSQSIRLFTDPKAVITRSEI